MELEPSFVRQLTDYGRAGIHHKGTSECASKETLLVAHPWGAKTPNLTTTKSPDGDFFVVELGGFAPPSREQPLRPSTYLDRLKVSLLILKRTKQ